MKLTAIVHRAEDGGYWAEVPALPGCATQGDTMRELRANLREAVAGCLEVLEEKAARKASSKGTLIEVAV